MRSGILLKTAFGAGAPGAALIEQYDPVAGWVEKATMVRLAPRPWAAMQKHRWQASRIAAFLDMQAMPPASV
jgi:hypothetical protein